MNTRCYRICTRCIMDTSDPEIAFDAEGRCNHCIEALERMKTQLLPPLERERALAALVGKIKNEGQGKEYDCIIGVSGGVDSTTVAYTVKKLGLRPLAVHFDNGWDSELAVDNIKRTIEMLDIELYTYVVDWEEFRDLQLCFLRASVANCETPTDHGITAILFRMAAEVGTRFIRQWRQPGNRSDHAVCLGPLQPGSQAHQGASQTLRHAATQDHAVDQSVRLLPLRLPSRDTADPLPQPHRLQKG